MKNTTLKPEEVRKISKDLQKSLALAKARRETAKEIIRADSLLNRKVIKLK